MSSITVQEPVALKEPKHCFNCERLINIDEPQYGTPDNPLCAQCVAAVDNFKSMSINPIQPEEKG